MSSGGYAASRRKNQDGPDPFAAASANAAAAAAAAEGAANADDDLDLDILCAPCGIPDSMLAATPVENFEAAKEFLGFREGQLFKTGDRGLGYYKNIPPVPDPSLKEYEAPPKDTRKVTVQMDREEESGEVTYWKLGDDYPIGDTDVEIFHQCARIKKIENLEAVGANLKKICLIANNIEKMEGFETNINLEHLELYQNFVKTMENISHLNNLRTLDLSFNKIRRIEGIGECPFLESLYLSSNKITEVEGVSHLTSLKLLELGANRLRSVPAQEVATLVNLEELFLGKNKIVNMALPPLPKLRNVSMQNNRLEKWSDEFFVNCPNVSHLYLGFNNLPDLPPEFMQLTKLEEVDLAKNNIKHIQAMPNLTKLRELWMNDNHVEDIAEVRNLSSMPSLECVYLERCPFQKQGDEKGEKLYKEAILEAVPDLLQLDALRLDYSVQMVNDGLEHRLPGIRKR